MKRDKSENRKSGRKRGKIFHQILAWMLLAAVCVQALPVYAEEFFVPNMGVWADYETPEDAGTAETPSEEEGADVQEPETPEVDTDGEEQPETGGETDTEGQPETDAGTDTEGQPDTDGEIDTEEQPDTSVDTDTEEQPEIDEETDTEIDEEAKPEDAPGDTETGEENTEELDVSAVYEDGVIKIYTQQQLFAIGTGETLTVTDQEPEGFGKGAAVVENGAEVAYAADGSYQLMNDIVLDSEELWTLPEDFTGAFLSAGYEETLPLYDAETDTIYVYHNYQLMLAASQEGEEQPVLSGDSDPENFGIGNPISLLGGGFLTYSKEHRYVLSQGFTERMPELKTDEIADEVVWLEGEKADGRTTPGQLYYEIDGEKYILIGNESQLRAIGSDKYVTPRLYIYTSGLLVKTSYTPYYPGDADLGLEAVAKESGTGDEVKQKEYQYFTDHGKYELASVNLSDKGILGGILGGLAGILGGDSEFCGVNAQGLPDSKTKNLTQLQKEYGGLKYSADANYIIFRNIDLGADGENSNTQDDLWTPIHFSGKLEGRLGMQEGTVPAISGIHVTQTGKLNLETTSGIGFFGTISNKLNDKTFQSAGTVLVKNLHLDGVTIDNQSSEVDDNVDSLVEGLTKVLGNLLGGILGGITSILPIPGVDKLQLGEVIRGLLTLKQGSADVFAAGSFAGRITGDVTIEGCTVSDASVTSVTGLTGGFAGYVAGEEKYDLLSHLGENTVTLLSTLLNIIPGVGLGDLISLLLEKNALPLQNLIPIGYYRPSLERCSVSLTKGSMGSLSTDYHGGFVGMQTGTDLTDCSVKGLTSVQAKTGAGGFAGIERDAVIKGLLSDLGVDLTDFNIRSVQNGCSVESEGLTITAAEQYAGGFNGVMANSVSTLGTVSGLASVEAKAYAGGYAGRATIGYGLAVGGTDEKKNTLLNGVSGLLGDLLTEGNEGKRNTLLSLSGAQASQIQGCSTAGKDGLTITASDRYAGGIIGQGDGVQITGSGDTKTSVTELFSVHAKSYAGGVAGSVSTADAIGVLNSTVGVGQYLPFTISDTRVSGDGFTVEADMKYAAGAAGLMLGGTAAGVEIQGLSHAEAGNYAAGFAGRAGTADLASTGGLSVLGLVKVNNLLSLASGIRVTIENSSVTGADGGFTVLANGTAEVTDGEAISAGGFVAEAVGIGVSDSEVNQVKEVRAVFSADKKSYAGGFVGRSHTGGLAGLAQEGDDGSLKLPGILEADSLLQLVPYLTPEYRKTTVTFADHGENPQVVGQSAGGYAGSMQSGEVDNEGLAEPYAVYALRYIKGQDFAGGFAGEIHAGGAASSDGLKLLDNVLKLDISQLVNVLQVYIPQIASAGVKSAEGGFIVEAVASDSSAGGYVGSGSGVKIRDSHVTDLKYTPVTPPSDSLESADGSSYFSEASSYAVRGGRYAGGYAGCLDIDSAAAVGGGLKLLDSLELGNLLQALDTTASSVENSNVTGAMGGYAVLADGTDGDGNIIGKAGGYAGELSGSSIRNSDAVNFSYIIGREAAGGYAGLLEPGNVAAVLENSSVLDQVLNISENLASVVQSFIPIIEDSQASSIPCGGAVRAEGFTDEKLIRGMAGGYAGYNHGGRILGENRECAVYRIRSVYGGECAGGFTGLMENADLAKTGNLSLLFGLISTSNVVSLLGAVYPTETNTAVYGPLRNLDLDTWNAWADAVGSNGVYGYAFPSEKAENQGALNALIKKYAYGYQVKAGRTEAGALEKQMGSAGGYAGAMIGGVVTEAHAWDAKTVTAFQSAGGFAGDMLTGGAAEVGGVSILGLPITGAISAVQTFVPVIRNSDITGFQSGLQVKATGIPKQDGTLKIEKAGYAGGFVGHMTGGQIWGNWQEGSAADEDISGHSATDAVPDPTNDRCFVANLRRVEGTNAVGGFAGRIDPGSAAALDTAGSSGLLGGLLQNLIKTPGDLLSLLNSTLSTVRAADVSAWDDWGILIRGVYTDGGKNVRYAKSAGGFAGEMHGAVIGESGQPESGVHVRQLRNVTGGEYAGGFFGLADVSAVAEITGEGNTSILAGLLSLGSTDVLDAFRTYVYDSSVEGALDAGLEVLAQDRRKLEYDKEPVYTGNAGGFGGALLNGSVKNSSVTNLRQVTAQNYSGGFIGHLGKSGVVDVDKLNVFDSVLGLGAGVLDIFGSHVDDSHVTGMDGGFTVKSKSTVNSDEKSEIAGGFAGFADLARMSGNTVSGLKQVASGETAGGFAGRTSFAYLAELKADSEIVQVLLKYLNTILQDLWLRELQKGDVITIDLGLLLKVQALYDGEFVRLKLLGLDVKIALAKDEQLATVYIGDSKIELNCDTNGNIQNPDAISDTIRLSLIKANRTRIDGCTVTGISIGYDVYGGGAGNKENGTGDLGCAGGFVGLNDEGLLLNNQMFFADVIRGTAGKTGPFTGLSALNSSWDFNTVAGIEGENNSYRIYREADASFDGILGKGKQELQSGFAVNAPWNVYTITHMEKGKVERFTDLEDAVLSNGVEEKELLAYQEAGAMAVLMNHTPTAPTEPGDAEEEPDIQDPCDDLVELRVKKIWKQDQEENRPESIRLVITRTYEKDGTEVQDDTFQEIVILDSSDAITENIWEKVLTGDKFPAYHTGSNGEKYYYTYYISEDKLDGYDSQITYQGDYHYSMTITNTRKPAEPLPETGGVGTRWIYAIGILLLTAVVTDSLRKRRRENAGLL